MQTTIDVRRRDQRMQTRIGWLDSKHSFSFGGHHEPDNTHFGLLLVSNDDIVAGGSGFDTHPHRDMEIITWVLAGELEHKDSEGNRGLIYPGLAQRMSAGTGIWHSEMNPRGDAAHFVQMWVVPDTERIDPGYEQLDISGELARGGLVPVASGQGHDAAIAIRQRDAVLWAGRLAGDERQVLPDAPFLHLFVAKGGVELDGAGRLNAGDAVRLTASEGVALQADPEGAEVLLWEMHRQVQIRR